MAFTARDALRRHEQARAARCFLPGAQTIPQSWRYRELVKMFVRHQNRWLMLLSNNVSDSKRRAPSLPQCPTCCIGQSFG